MPCNTITTVSLELKNANTALLRKAVEAVIGERGGYLISHNEKFLRWSMGGSYDRQTGKLTVQSEAQGNKIKQYYSGEVVKAQAKKFGWQVKTVGANKFEIIKR
jgi:hypothetical protein